ncbi:MAG: ABC transporter permease [Phycisphaerales bacterium]|nr:ABC transporter permease [Phycisphaerales bacterium]
MLTQLLAIARNALIESVRQPIFFILIMVSGVAQVFNNLLSTYSMGYSDSSEVSGDEKLFLDIGLSTILIALTLLAAFIATAVLSREIEQKTALTVVSKPVARPLFVIGKYLGVSAAMAIATGLMLLFFLLSLQHGVMSRAMDEVDQPVLVFGLGAVALSMGVALWGNYFYGWMFTSSATLIMLPLVFLAWVITLFMGPDWRFQGFMGDLRPQILLASVAVGISMLVLTAVAVCCSTRLGQVMTIVVCLGVFLFGLLSNHLVGRRAFVNDPIERIASAEAVVDENGDLSGAGDTWRITLGGDPRVDLTPGDSFFFASDPSGVDLVVPRHRRFAGDLSRPESLRSPESGPALVVTAVEDGSRTVTIVNAGGLAVRRVPVEGDYAFRSMERGSVIARLVWSVTPNMQFFWLVDAVTQTHAIPPSYLGKLALYSLSQITALLSIGVILFQKREVG